MPTPPRIIEQVPRQRAEELEQLRGRLSELGDKLKLAAIYALDGAPETAAQRAEAARQLVLGILEELNTFRAPATTPARKASTPPAQE